MVAAVVISSIVFLTEDLTCRRLDIMLLEVEIALEVKVTCREEGVNEQDGRRAGKRLVIMIRRRAHYERAKGGCGSAILGIYALELSTASILLV